MSTFFFAFLGLIVGSFLNVLVLRWGAATLGGRSACMSCAATIRWYDNIPLVSWLLLRGRCRECGSVISVQYPLVELSTGVLFALIGGTAHVPLDSSGVYPGLILLLSCAIGALLIAIAVYDIRHTIIPDAWAYTFALAAFSLGFLAPIAWLSQYNPFLFMVSGPLAAVPLFALWAVSRGRWMGFGDVKLALGIGWLLGPLNGIFAVFLAFIIGAVVSLPLLLISSRAFRRLVAGFTHTPTSQKSVCGFTMKSEIPFGPFLVLSCIIVWLSLMYGVEPLSILGLLPL
ncbi:prepilin peptidase [Candidatus Kaiserbacteria bacterium]|nr:prepilin peptidase [Candidatus Kaiserbacteria bacterium]